MYYRTKENEILIEIDNINQLPDGEIENFRCNVSEINSNSLSNKNIKSLLIKYDENKNIILPSSLINIIFCGIRNNFIFPQLPNGLIELHIIGEINTDILKLPKLPDSLKIIYLCGKLYKNIMDQLDNIDQFDIICIESQYNISIKNINNFCKYYDEDEISCKLTYIKEIILYEYITKNLSDEYINNYIEKDEDLCFPLKNIKDIVFKFESYKIKSARSMK